MSAPRGRIIRRVLSHHSSDCPLGPHSIRSSRCVIVTRRDTMRPKRSVLTLRGDWQESRVFKRHVIHAWAAAVYGGGFWERVEIPPLDEKATS